MRSVTHNVKTELMRSSTYPCCSRGNNGSIFSAGEFHEGDVWPADPVLARSRFILWIFFGDRCDWFDMALLSLSTFQSKVTLMKWKN